MKKAIAVCVRGSRGVDRLGAFERAGDFHPVVALELAVLEECGGGRFAEAGCDSETA